VSLPRTPSQTVGPYYAIGLCRRTENEPVPADERDAIRVIGRLLDGDEQPIGDGMIEVWQASGGLWGRSGTDAQGGFSFLTVKPPASGGEAPHLDVYVFARGLLKHQLTRMYFPDEADANAGDPVLSSLPAADRAVLVGEQEDGAVRFDIRMQGDRQTVFFAT
jgi:protocatechuate 3,4-dioxygenase, alpha subunit